jgi:hypothetical protein
MFDLLFFFSGGGKAMLTLPTTGFDRNAEIIASTTSCVSYSHSPTPTGTDKRRLQPERRGCHDHPNSFTS